MEKIMTGLGLLEDSLRRVHEYDSVGEINRQPLYIPNLNERYDASDKVMGWIRLYISSSLCVQLWKCYTSARELCDV